MAFFIYFCYMNLRLVISVLLFPVGVMLVSCGGSGSTTAIKPVIDSTEAKIPKELQQLNEQLKSDQGNAALYHKRAQYFYNTQRYSEGLADMLRAINIDSSKAAYFITLSDLYFVNNQTAKTKAALEKCIQLDDKNTDAMLKLAELYFYVRKYEQSVKYINMALKLDKYNAKGYFMKGMNYKELADTARAISSMQTAVEQDQQYYHAYMQLGMLCAAKKNPLAVEYYKNAIRIKPASGEALYSLGKYYQDSNQFDKALETYNDLLHAETSNINAYYNMGVIHLVNLKKYDLATNYFTTAIKINPKYVQAYYGRGLSQQAAGNIKQAVSDFQACIDIDPKFEPATSALKELAKSK
jgi:tetratricopeptide (TPR) repeat protein